MFIITFAYVGISMLSKPSSNDTHDPDRFAETNAIPSEDYPLAGFWKTSPNNKFGYAIGPNNDGTYYISFCGPGGCFKPGTYMPNSKIIGDPAWEVIDMNTIKLKGIKDVYRRAPDNKR